MPERLECEVLQKVRYINTLRPTCTYLPTVFFSIFVAHYYVFTVG